MAETARRHGARCQWGTEKRSGGAGRPKAHPIGLDAAAAVGGPVTVGPALTKEESNNGAGHPTAQTISAALAASAEGTVRAGTALASGGAQREEGGDETPKRARAETDFANDVTEEIPTPKRSRAPNASGRRGGEGRGGTPTQQCAPMARSNGAGRDPREAQRGKPLRGGATRTGKGPPACAWIAGDQHRMDGDKGPPQMAARA